MKSSKDSIKKRLKIALIISFIIVVALILRLGNLQIIRNHELKTEALQQWTKSISISPERGNIYDRKGKKLAISVNASTVWATSSEMEDLKKTSKSLAGVLEIDEKELYNKLNSKESTQKIKQWISREKSNELKKLNLSGITIVEDTKRYYPNGNFASYILGFTDIDNKGLDGVEYIYNDYLSGVPGKLMKMTDGANRQLPYDGEKTHKPEDGSSLLLTIDENIQQFAEKAADQALIDTKAKNVSVLMMDVNNGEVLAMVNKPDFDPNNPREPMDEKQGSQWSKLSYDEQEKKWYELWRNPIITDIYEPGSTFKVITAAAALEEATAGLNSHYHCKGTIDVRGTILKCARWYEPHGDQTLKDAMNNSCNVAFVKMSSQLGKENLHKYIKAFGFGEKTNIDLLGEQYGIIPREAENIKEVSLATLSYGHGIAVTPIQLVTAVSAIANGGDLLEPRILKEVINSEGDIIESFEAKKVRKVISEKTSNEILTLMESVVSEGSGSRAYIPGYKIGGKTGTAQKVVDGVYKPGKFIGSFVAVAPVNDSKIAMLVLVDEPVGNIFGGSVAAPVAQSILEDTYEYLGIDPEYTEEEKKNMETLIEVPDVRNKKIGEAGKILNEAGLKHTTEYVELDNDSIILEQFPLPGEKVQKRSVVDLFIDFKPSEEIIVPFLDGKSKEEVIKILSDIGLKYELKGGGTVIEQDPQPGEKVKLDTNIIVKFK